jgi:EAL and modified HD-GYP domain-containing signal transduction protein
VPALVSKRKIPANKIFHVQLLQTLQEDPLDVRKLSDLVKRDAALMYRLLRLVNSPASAIRQEVRSIESALLAVGDDLFQRIATLAIASELNAGHSPEVLRMAFVRARFCELASGLCALDPAEQYLLGIFSLLPAMLGAPMKEALVALPLRKPVQEALLGKPNGVRCLLQWIEAEEHGDWAHCQAIAQSHGLRQDDLSACYRDAVAWAEASLPAAEQEKR